ncbi:MAG: glycoside hydrolase family 3 C-terminal domain-containing protein [Clostridiales bacterium]|nr:glycoside hydrolase family 3 C-terminal domain-containing protein [Clostridiales bacterium]
MRSNFFLCNTAVIVGNEAFDLVSDTVRFNLYAVLIVLFGFLFAVRCLKGYWQQHLVTILFFKDCVLFVSFLYKTTEDTWTELLGDSPFAWLVGKVISIVMILLAALLCKPMSHPIHTPISAGYWCISALTPVLLLLLWEQIDGATPNGANGDLAMNAAVNAMLLEVSFFAYALFVRLAREMEKQMELQLTNQSLAFQIRQVDDAQAQLEQTRTARHEMKNTYFYLESLLEQGKYDEMRQVLADEMALSEETQAESLELAETIADEGIVLLKNDDDALPISTDTKLNVFGWGSTQPVYGGSGSGDVDESTATSLLQGLKDAGYTLNDDLSQFYVDYRSDRPEVGMMSEDWTIVQPTMEEYDEAGIFEQAVEFSDTAIIVLTRSGGEGMDLPDTYSSDCTYNTTQQGGDVVYSTQEDDIDSSKSYLELSNREIELVERVTSEFSNVIVIINSSNVMEMGWVDEYDNINAVLWVAGAGVNGFEALGEILSGEVNPSGKTVDTWVYDLKNTPTSNNFGEYAYTNSDEINGGTGEVKFVNYVESIYVGYKFYETAAVEGLIDYDSTVQYPFGYGLSYTTFEQEISSFSVSGTTVTMEVTVTNTGSVAGKDVVEVYFDPPTPTAASRRPALTCSPSPRPASWQPGPPRP